MIHQSSTANLTMWTITCPVCGMRSEKFSATTAIRTETEHGLLHDTEASDEGYTTGNAHNGRRDANPYRSES